jgi:hypothetical protein
LRLGIPGLQNLESAIEQKPVAPVGAHAPANPVGRLDHQRIEALLAKRDGAGKPGETGADDDDV